jgi:hypothetical protein
LGAGAGACCGAAAAAREPKSRPAGMATDAAGFGATEGGATEGGAIEEGADGATEGGDADGGTKFVKSSDSPSSSDAAGPGERVSGAAGDCRTLPKREKAKLNQRLRK